MFTDTRFCYAFFISQLGLLISQDRFAQFLQLCLYSCILLWSLIWGGMTSMAFVSLYCSAGQSAIVSLYLSLPCNIYIEWLNGLWCFSTFHSLEQLSNTSSKFQPRWGSWSIYWPALCSSALDSLENKCVLSIMEHSRCLNQVSVGLCTFFLFLYFQ